MACLGKMVCFGFVLLCLMTGFCVAVENTVSHKTGVSLSGEEKADVFEEIKAGMQRKLKPNRKLRLGN